MGLINKIFGNKYDEREKKRRGKRRKRRGKRRKIYKGKNYDKICNLRGEKGYIIPHSVRYLLMIKG